MDENIQQKLYNYQIMTEQQRLYAEQLLSVEQGIQDSLATEEALKELEKQKNGEILVPLGKECFINAGLKDNRVLVDLVQCSGESCHVAVGFLTRSGEPGVNPGEDMTGRYWILVIGY